MDEIKHMMKVLNEAFVSQLPGLDEAAKKLDLSPVQFVLAAADEKIKRLSKLL